MDIKEVREYTKVYVESLVYDTIFYDEIYKQKQLNRIENAENLSRFVSAIEKGNRFDYLNFLNRCSVITDKECANEVYNIWTMQEQFFGCGMAKIRMIKFMKLANKNIIFPAEIEQLTDNDMIPIYRGTSVNNYRGLSWTLEQKKAEWFAKRFPIGDSKRYVFDGKIRKKDIIAFFNDRNEKEVVCDYRKIKDIHCKEVNMDEIISY